MKGTVVYLYAFDVAGEIRTSEVREVLSEKPFPFQIRVGATAPRDVPIYRPLMIGLKPEERETSVGRVTLKPFVKVFDIGALSVSFELVVDVAKLADLVPYHQLHVDGVPLTELAEKLCARVAEDLRPYMAKPSTDRPPAEAYTVFCLADVGAQDVPAWARDRRGEIAGLLIEEPDPRRLAPDQVGETLRHSLSYTTDDLTVIDWDAALILDRSGYFDDVLYMIELANIQLDEFRLLDDRLDLYFLRAYGDLENFYKAMPLFRTPEKTLGNLRAIRMDITRMSEEATNITKFVGDWYLARVYLACKDRFHLAHWESSVDQKLKQLDDVYSLVQSEINGRRMLLLEATIVALFVFDIVLLFIRK